MDRPPADPAKLLAHWMEWERGETPPGRVMSNLKTSGLRELLEHLAEDAASAPATTVGDLLGDGGGSGETVGDILTADPGSGPA
jgi:hypothetical protein